MKHLLLLVLSCGLCLAWSRRSSMDAGARATYTIDLRDADANVVAVRARFEGMTARALELQSPVNADLSNLVAHGGPPRTSLREGGRRRSVLRLEAAPCVTLDYRIRIAARDGWIDGTGALLPLASIALVPTEALRSVHLRVLYPPHWSRVRDLPSRIDAPSRGAWRRRVLCAFESRVARRRLACGVDLVRAEGSSDGAERGVRALLEALRARLGPPRVPLEVVLEPERADASPLAHEHLAELDWTAVHGAALDLIAARRLVRRAVPRWFGTTAAELERRAGPDAWFLLGVAEWLAWRLPIDLGLADRDWRGALRRTWVASELRDVDLARAPLGDPDAARDRRLAAGLLVAELDEVLAGVGGLDALLAAYVAGSHDAARTGAPGFAEFERRYVHERAPFPFARDFELRLDEFPRASRPSLDIVFTAGTRGELDKTCKSCAGDALARRVSAVRCLRGAAGAFALFDLGRWAAVPLQELARPHATPATRLFESIMGPEALDYDGVVFSPSEFYSGLALHESRARSTSVGFGVEREGRPSLQPWTTLRPRRVVCADGRGRDVTIAFVGYCELLEPADLYEELEPNLRGVTFPREHTELLEVLRALASEHDLLIVGGSFLPATLDRLCDPESGVDVVLLDGGNEYSGPRLGRRGETLVAVESGSLGGIHRLRLTLDGDRPAIVGAELSEHRLREFEPADDILARVDAIR